MNNWRYKLASYMAGRRGIDEYGKFLLVASFAAFLLSYFVLRKLLYILGFVLLIYAYSRIMSRNITKRQMENLQFLQIKSKVLRRFGGYKEAYDQTKYYRYFKCSKCGQNCRVPKGKGKIRITCPKCGNVFEKRT